MGDWFTNLTQPQATLGSAAITFAGAIVAVLLGWRLFSAKVRDIRSALTVTDELLKAHQASVQQTLADIEAKISGLAASTGQLRGDIGDRQSANDEPGTAGAPSETERLSEVDGLPVDLFSTVETNWHTIRDYLEEVAADPSIDGRTAAKYQRIDRRSYAALINSLVRDDVLPSAEGYLEAARIWSRYRSRRMSPSPQDAARITLLAKTLVGIANLPPPRQVAT